MSKKLTISLACGGYDRVRAIQDGRVQIEGCETVFLRSNAEETFARAFRTADYDVCELSFSTHLLTTSRDGSPYIGVPAFVSRAFRHSSIYIRTDRGISRPEDLRGKKIGVPDYQMTALLWVRGMLEDDYGVKPSDIHWRWGGQEQPGRAQRTPLTLPPEIDLQPIPSDATLSEMLIKGELDAIMTAREPSCFARKAPNIDRLFPDTRAAEEDYFRRTKRFPIMHIIGVRKDLAEKHPWLPANVYKAFAEAKAIAQAELDQIGVLYATSPWLLDDLKRVRAVMGADPWTYGFQANRTEIEDACRYSFSQGLSGRLVAGEELFARNTLIDYKI